MCQAGIRGEMEETQQTGEMGVWEEAVGIKVMRWSSQDMSSSIRQPSNLGNTVSLARCSVHPAAWSASKQILPLEGDERGKMSQGKKISAPHSLSAASSSSCQPGVWTDNVTPLCLTIALFSRSSLAGHTESSKRSWIQEHSLQVTLD